MFPLAGSIAMALTRSLCPATRDVTAPAAAETYVSVPSSDTETIVSGRGHTTPSCMSSRRSPMAMVAAHG